MRWRRPPVRLEAWPTPASLRAPPRRAPAGASLRQGVSSLTPHVCAAQVDALIYFNVRGQNRFYYEARCCVCPLHLSSAGPESQTAAPQWVFSPLPGSTIPPNCKCAPCPETRRVSARQLRKTKTAFRGSFHRPSPALVSAARSPDSRPLASRSCDADAYNCMWVSPQARPRPTLRRRLRPPRPDDSRPIPPSPGRSDRRSL